MASLYSSPQNNMQLPIDRAFHKQEQTTHLLAHHLFWRRAASPDDVMVP